MDCNVGSSASSAFIKAEDIIPDEVAERMRREEMEVGVRVCVLGGRRIILKRRRAFALETSSAFKIQRLQGSCARI